jgi:hypothetical protein
MRTTLNIQDEAFKLASHYAQARAIKLGDAISELVLKGGVQHDDARSFGIVAKGDTWVLEVPADAPVVTPELVRDLLDEGA